MRQLWDLENFFWKEEEDAQTAAKGWTFSLGRFCAPACGENGTSIVFDLQDFAKKILFVELTLH